MELHGRTQRHAEALQKACGIEAACCLWGSLLRFWVSVRQHAAHLNKLERASVSEWEQQEF